MTIPQNGAIKLRPLSECITTADDIEI